MLEVTRSRTTSGSRPGSSRTSRCVSGSAPAVRICSTRSCDLSSDHSACATVDQSTRRPGSTSARGVAATQEPSASLATASSRSRGCSGRMSRASAGSVKPRFHRIRQYPQPATGACRLSAVCSRIEHMFEHASALAPAPATAGSGSLGCAPGVAQHDHPGRLAAPARSPRSGGGRRGADRADPAAGGAEVRGGGGAGGGDRGLRDLPARRAEGRGRARERPGQGGGRAGGAGAAGVPAPGLAPGRAGAGAGARDAGDDGRLAGRADQ